MKMLNHLILITVSSALFATSTQAEEIRLTGTLSEFSCSADSRDLECKEVATSVDTLRSLELQSFNDLKDALPKQQKMVESKLISLETEQHKVFLLNYH